MRVRTGVSDETRFPELYHSRLKHTLKVYTIFCFVSTLIQNSVNTLMMYRGWLEFRKYELLRTMRTIKSKVRDGYGCM
jgi:hypothetical protein